MILLYDNNLFKYYYEIISRNINFNQNMEYYKNYALMQIDNIWSEFYSIFVRERGMKDSNFDKNKNYFLEFLEIFEKEWFNCMKDIYSNDNQKYEVDLTNISVKNLKRKIDCKINANELSQDFDNFKKILENITLSDIIKKID